VHDQRIDAAPDIIHNGIAADLDPAGLGIDLDFAHRTAIGKHRIVHFVVGYDGKFALQPKARHLLRQFEKVEAAIAARRSKTAIGECDVANRRTENWAATAFALAISPGAALASRVATYRIDKGCPFRRSSAKSVVQNPDIGDS